MPAFVACRSSVLSSLPVRDGGSVGRSLALSKEASFEFLAERLELLPEVRVADLLARRDADVGRDHCAERRLHEDQRHRRGRTGGLRPGARQAANRA